MDQPVIPYLIFPLGDSAITVSFGNTINEPINRAVIAAYQQLQQNPIEGVIEAAPAYCSLTIYYDVFSISKKIRPRFGVYEWVKQQLIERLQLPLQQDYIAGHKLQIPVCYEEEFAPDLHQLAAVKNLSADEIISIHKAGIYKVYMIGFLPGFAYMGEVDEKISMPRKPQPVPVVEGSVGIAGRQTGIYPLSSPGGWQIIGRTPLKLFKAPPNLSGGEASGDSINFNTINNSPTLLRAGDNVQFYSISKSEFYEIQNSPSTRSGEEVGG